VSFLPAHDIATFIISQNFLCEKELSDTIQSQFWVSFWTSAVFLKLFIYGIRILEVPVWNELFYIVCTVLHMHLTHKNYII
jgi:hypothetical protein